MAEHIQIGCATLNDASVALESFTQLWGWRKRSLHHNLRKLERLLEACLHSRVWSQGPGDIQACGDGARWLLGRWTVPS
jgi:hypothetical protein